MEIINKKYYYYSDRASKAEFVYNRYKSILKGNILDIGADELYLKEYLPKEVTYKGIGFGEHPELIKINLEKEPIPFPNNSFDCVLCLDVLEHLENIHEMFDNIANLSKKWILISLPNPLAALYESLSVKPYSKEQLVKFYGLPFEKPQDRHKWFFSLSEAQSFIKYKAKKNKLKVIDEFIKGESDGLPNNKSFKNRLKRRKFNIARNILFLENTNFKDFFSWTYWVVLMK